MVEQIATYFDVVVEGPRRNRHRCHINAIDDVDAMRQAEGRSSTCCCIACRASEDTIRSSSTCATRSTSLSRAPARRWARHHRELREDPLSTFCAMPRGRACCRVRRNSTWARAHVSSCDGASRREWNAGALIRIAASGSRSSAGRVRRTVEGSVLAFTHDGRVGGSSSVRFSTPARTVRPSNGRLRSA